jgi:hypothetical protein
VLNRHNYILWLKTLLDSTSYDPRRRVVGLDIGTGASCIYPLLGCTQRPWSFIATGLRAASHDIHLLTDPQTLTSRTSSGLPRMSPQTASKAAFASSRAVLPTS